MITGKNGKDKTLHTPVASILMPAYNVEKYLRRAVDSVLNQTYKDFEVVLIDDGSTDGTPQICDEYGKKYDFIRVYHQQNIGNSRTREILIQKAEGEFIFWLDADDYYDSTLLEKAVKVFEENDTDIVYWNYAMLVSDKGKIIEQQVDEIELSTRRELNKWGLWPMVWWYASKKELWENIVRVPDDVDLTDDVWLTAQVVSKTEKIILLSEVLYYYDQTNVNSVIHSYTGKRLCREALALYRIIKMRQRKCTNVVPRSLSVARDLLVKAYCVHCVNPDLTGYQIDLIKGAIKDLNNRYKQKKIKKEYLIQYCVIHGIDSICRWYGKNLIQNFEREQNK